MASAVITVTKPTDVKDTHFGDKKAIVRDITADTGDYAANGFSVTAAQLGLKHIDWFSPDAAATTGTNGATSNVLGVRYVSSGTSVRISLYESAGSGSPPAEKGAEAYDANFTFRALVIGR